MENVIKAIYKWQKDAGNLDRKYEDDRENAYPIEEALEGFNLNYIDTGFQGNPRDLSIAIMNHAKLTIKAPIPDVDKVDKHCDQIIFAIGSLGKLGLNAQQIQQALLIVNKANKQKLKMPRDELGKLTKPDGFVGPEAELQVLLDKVNETSI